MIVAIVALFLFLFPTDVQATVYPFVCHPSPAGIDCQNQYSVYRVLRNGYDRLAALDSPYASRCASAAEAVITMNRSLWALTWEVQSQRFLHQCNEAMMKKW